MNDKEEKALWVEFAKVAIENYEIPEEIDNLDDLVDDIVDTSTSVADAMVEECQRRFGGGGGEERPARRRSSGRGRGRGREREEEPETP